MALQSGEEEVEKLNKKNGVYTMRKWYIQCWWRDVNDIAKCLLPHQIENYDKETIAREREKKIDSHTS